MLRPLIMLIVILLGWNGRAFAQTPFAVPNIPGVCGLSGVIVTMSGGSGGESNSTGTGFPDGGLGGNGGAIVCTLNVAIPTVITSLTYYVGMQGAMGVPVYTGTTGAAGGTGYGNGGNAGNFAGPTGSVGTDVSGGGGGGSSAVLNTTGSTVLLVAGGGGGGGALSPTVVGGAAGNPGLNGGSFAPNFGGTGGTPGSFGAAGGVGIAFNGIAAEASDPGNGGNGGEGLTGSQSGGGGGAGYGGGGGGGAGNTVAAGVNTVTAGGGGGSNYVNPTAITTGLINGTATTTGNGAVTLVLYPAIASTTGVILCTGATSTFTETTPGGTWSSSNTAIATVSPATGSPVTVTAGNTIGTVNISYTEPSGYWSFVTVTVHAGAAPIAGPTSVCATQSIILSDSTSGGAWTSSAPGIATVSALGLVTGVSAGTAVITYTLPSGCDAILPVTVYPEPGPVGGTLSVCMRNTTTLTDAVAGGIWTSSDTAVATIDPASGVVTPVSPGITTITYGFAGMCLTTADLTVNPLPFITGEDSTNPTTCGGSDGTITLNGLISGTSYLVNYDYNGSPATVVTITANSFQVRINVPSAGLLDTGTYTNIYVTDAATGCVSDTVGPITLVDPPNPPAPVITSSQPLCNGQTLFLAAADALPGGTYSWAGPNGFISSIQKPDIVGATYADSGIYTVIYTLFNCISLPDTADIAIESPPPLTNVTVSQTILYGSGIQLNADNAFQYMWTPDNGTLSDPNINDPIATPSVTTTYTVYGMSQYGCLNSALITITVDSTMTGGIPTAFTPNNDGLNDIFRPVGSKFQRLVEFRVYNRWGQQVFYSNNVEHGWDGTFNGVPQDMGDYYYQIIVAQPGATENIAYKGSVTLIR